MMTRFSERRSRVAILLTLLITVGSISATAQGTVEDYKRADALRGQFADKVFYGNVRPQWAGETDYFTYENQTPGGREYILVDPYKMKKQQAFDTKKFAEALSKQTGNKIDHKDLPVSGVTFSEDLKSFSFMYERVRWECRLPSYKLTPGERAGGDNRRQNRGSGWAWGTRDETGNDPVESPDKNYTAFIKDYNLFIKEKDGKETQLSFDGGIGLYYSSASISWSPDSRRVFAYKLLPAEKHMIHYIESSPDNQIQPQHHAYEYTKPGDALQQYSPQLFDIENKKHIAVDNSIYPNQFSMGRFQWRKDSRAITFEYNKRGHQNYQVISLDAETGKQTVIVDERSDTFIDYSGKRYRYDVNDGEEIIWASERDGWNHLYLYDGSTGRVKNQITKGEWVVRNVENVDPEERRIIFTASGREEGDPYFIHYYSINFDGSGLRRLTSGEGNHSASFSPGYRYFVDTWSTVENPPVSVLRRVATGEEVMSLEKADITALIDAGWQKPEVFVSKARDGKTDIWGVIVRPTNFDPSKKYPVIEYIYAGPHSSFVPKSFFSYNGSLQPLAELGFILVQIDGMGTSNRSKAFHDVAWKNLKDAGFPDRILWMKDAASRYSYMDIENVGIFGTSAGGQNSAGAVIFHPEFYDVAVSSCGCHDNRMDKIWWNEQFMGWPVGPEYAESSNVENAHRMKGRMMLINGEMDFNVDPASTVQLVDALIKANKEFEYILVPGMGHSSGGNFGEHKRRDYFVKHLLGIDPPRWSEFDK